MKRALLKRKSQTCYFHDGILAFAVCLLLAPVGLAQNAETRITFMSTRSDNNGEIFLMNSDGKRVRRLTKHLKYDAVPAWSPDGRKIAYTSFRGEPEPHGEIYVMNPNGTNPINLTQSPEIRESSPSWSPDGKQITYQSWGIFNANGFFQSDIWVMDADGANPRNLTNHIASARSPDWSPDGMRIAFSSDRDKAWEFDTWDNQDVYVMNADGTNPINLTNHPARDGGPDWSPDGMRIAFSTNRDGDWKKKPNDNWEVYVMNADGINPINLTNHLAWDSSPAWEPASPLSVSLKGRLATLWGNVKRTNTYGGR